MNIRYYCSAKMTAADRGQCGESCRTVRNDKVARKINGRTLRFGRLAIIKIAML
jgi:hypothetical protein